MVSVVLEGVSFAYDSVIDGPFFRVGVLPDGNVEEGIGANGADKTTLLPPTCGELAPRAGRGHRSPRTDAPSSRFDDVLRSTMGRRTGSVGSWAWRTIGSTGGVLNHGERVYDARAGKRLPRFEDRIAHACEAREVGPLLLRSAMGIDVLGSRSFRNRLVCLPAGRLDVGEGRTRVFDDLRVRPDDRDALVRAQWIGEEHVGASNHRSCGSRSMTAGVRAPGDRCAHVRGEARGRQVAIRGGSARG